MKKVAIAILCNSMRFHKWQADIIRALHGHECCHLRGFIVEQNVPPAGARFPSNWSRMAWEAACAIEALLFRRKGADTNQLVDIGSEFEQTPKLFVTSDGQPTASNTRLRDADIEKCRELDCDIFIDFTIGRLSENIRGIPRTGIWSHHLADDRVHRGIPPGFWEFYDDDPVTAVTLRSADSDGGGVLARGFYRTERLSWRRNAESLYAKGSHLLLDKLVEFYALGASSVTREELPRLYAGRIRTHPDFMHSIIAVIKLLYRSALFILHKVMFRSVWELIIAERDRDALDLAAFARVIPPRGSFWADPFIVEHQGGLYIFFEEYKFNTKRGEIAVIKMEGTKPRPHRTIISTNYHLSFPYIFEFEGEMYMCPETSQNKAVEIWKCKKFPDVWKKERELFSDLSAADTVIFPHDGRWWLFTNVDRSGSGDHCYELRAFYADHPINGPWSPHGSNPLIVDTRCARNAGKIRWWDGLGLVRLSQINTGAYGSGIDIRPITKLDETCYHEESLRQIRPTWDRALTGLHHCDTSENYIVFDVCRRRSRLLS
jgi:hypothetical protein